MSYIFKQKLRIEDLVDLPARANRVLIHEPEEYLAALYGSYLRAHNLEVNYCQSVSLLSDSVKVFSPHLLIFNLEGDNEQSKISWLLNFKENFPSILVVTMGFNTGGETLKQLMPAGLSSHINRRLIRPQDIVDVVRALLLNKIDQN